MSNTLAEDDHTRKSMMDSMNTLKSSGNNNRSNQSNAINLKNRQLFTSHLNPDRLNGRQMTADIDQQRTDHNSSINSFTKSHGKGKANNHTPAASIRNLKFSNNGYLLHQNQ